MIGVTWASAAARRSRQAVCSSIGEAHATWCTVPAPPTPGVPGAGLFVVRAAAPSPARPPAVLARLELERFFQELTAVFGIRRERAHTVEALQRQLARDLRMLRDQRLVGRLDDGQLLAEALRVDEGEPVVAR